ncbi:hypothetical protein [Streptosporangium sp. NPDC002524]|uniref:hypothetical protein n=1 Tax=Streptosporangium sp. NPDC002524 TaxID=3154537 RepID=UPI0033315599
MTSQPTKISHPRHPLIAAHHQARRDHDRLLARHKHTAAAILADLAAHATSSVTIYAITAQDTTEDGDEILTWRRIGPVEYHGHLADQHGYIELQTSLLRASSPTNDEGLKWGANIWDVVAAIYPSLGDGDRYGKLIAGAHEAAPTVMMLLAIGAASGHLEWDTDETIAAAALRLSLDGAWSTRSTPSYNLREDQRRRHVTAATMELLGQVGDLRDYATNFLDNRAEILAALAEQNIDLGDHMLDTQEVADRARIATTTFTGYVAREQAPQPDAGKNSRKPKWHETTVTAWLLTRRA